MFWKLVDVVTCCWVHFKSICAIHSLFCISSSICIFPSIRSFFGHVRCVQNAKPNRKLHKGFHIHIYIRLLHIIFFLLLFAVGWAYSHHIVSILTKITIAICFVMCCAGVLWIKSIYVFALGQSNIFWLLFGRKLLAKFVLAS